MAIKLFSSLRNQGGFTSGDLPQGITAARVQYLVIDEKTNPEAWKKVQGYAGVGAIFYQSVNLPNPSKYPLAFKIAYPLFPNIKVFPLKKGVQVIRLPDGTAFPANMAGKIMPGFFNKMKDIDQKGGFESDDEVGQIFTGLKDTIEDLNKIVKGEQSE